MAEDLSLIQALEAFAHSHRTINRMSPPTPLHVDGYRVQVQFGPYGGSLTLILRILERNTPAHPHIYNPMPPREIYRMVGHLLARKNDIDEVRDQQTDLTRPMIDHLTDGWVFKHDIYGEGAALSRESAKEIQKENEKRGNQLKLALHRHAQGLDALPSGQSLPPLPPEVKRQVTDFLKYPKGGRKRTRKRVKARKIRTRMWR